MQVLRRSARDARSFPTRLRTPAVGLPQYCATSGKLRILEHRCAVRMAHQETIVSLSEGSNRSRVLDALRAMTRPTGQWALCEDGKGLERPFQFKTFKAAWTFMNDVAAECKVHKHHPEWSNVYNRVFVRWTTHMPTGLSDKDIDLANICDEFASREQSLEVRDESSHDVGILREIAGEAKAGVDDCCGTPKQRQKEREHIEEEEKPEGSGGLAKMGGQPS